MAFIEAMEAGSQKWRWLDPRFISEQKVYIFEAQKPWLTLDS